MKLNEKMKPIIFSTPMVQAILEGRKTMTRRVVKPQPKVCKEVSSIKRHSNPACKNWLAETNNGGTIGIVNIKSKYEPGDILWVRETWNQDPISYLYKADYGLIYKYQTWKPSIYMPRAAARIFLRVTDVRVERLQDISEADALNEGCDGEIAGTISIKPIEEYKALWDSINGKRGGAYKWDSNPWVWVIEFERVR